MPHRWGSHYSTMSPVKQRNQRGLASCGEVATTQQASVESQRIIIIVKHSYDLPSSIMLGTQEIEKQRQHRQQQPHRTKRESLRYARLTHLPCLSPCPLFSASSLSSRVTSITRSHVLQQQYSCAYKCIQITRLVNFERIAQEKRRGGRRRGIERSLCVSSSLPRRYLVVAGGTGNKEKKEAEI